MLKKLLMKQNLDRLGVPAVALIFLLLPFTTPLAIWLGSQVGQPDIFKAWKEIVLILTAGLLILSGAYRPITKIQEDGLKILIWLIAAYVGWTLLLGLLNLFIFDRVNLEAFLYALMINLRFLLFFVLCWLLAQTGTYLQTTWHRLVLIPAALVVIFGLLQAFVLPANVLEHIGYGPDTTAAYQSVDQNSDYARVQSTLRGPNPLGAYLIIVISLLVIGFKKRWWPQAALLGGSLVVLFYSYSRSAWLGMAAALATLVYTSITNTRLRRNLAIFGAGAILLFAGLVYVARDVQFVQKTIFHTDETSLSPESSNEQRAGALQRGLSDVAQEPFGRGPGSAGPASVHNDEPPRIAENYYLQIGQEIGWIGLTLFLAINIQIVRLLWMRRQHNLAKVLLASFAGLTLVSMLSHAWADETIALIWWGLAGIALTSLRPNPKSSS